MLINKKNLILKLVFLVFLVGCYDRQDVNKLQDEIAELKMKNEKLEKSLSKAGLDITKLEFLGDISQDEKDAIDRFNSAYEEAEKTKKVASLATEQAQKEKESAELAKGEAQKAKESADLAKEKAEKAFEEAKGESLPVLLSLLENIKEEAVKPGSGMSEELIHLISKICDEDDITGSLSPLIASLFELLSDRLKSEVKKEKLSKLI